MKGIKAARQAVNEILEGTEAMQLLLNVFSAAISDNHIPADNRAFLECAELMRAMNRLMGGEKARLEHLLSNAKVENASRRIIRTARAKHNVEPARATA